MEQRSAEWFRARCGRITGSRFADAMSRRNSQTYSQLIDELVRERRSNQVNRGYVSPAMQWGVDHESAARKWYSKAHGRSVREIAFVVHPQYDFVGVSPDGLVDPDGLVEIKCPQMTNFRRVLDSRKMPAMYRWQVQGQMWVCDRNWLDFVCFHPPTHGVVIRVNGSQKDFDRLEERCMEVNGEVLRRLALPPARRTAPESQIAHSHRSEPKQDSDSWWLWVWLVLGALVLFNL